MEMLRLEGSKSTPEIFFDHTNGTLNMSGESYPENSFEFFKPILTWVSEFTANHNGPVTLNMRLSYLNTGSTKCLMDILDLLEEYQESGQTVTVNWYYDEENDRALETAEDFKEDINLTFNIIPVREE